jgi:hypothetical protein
MGKSFTNYYGLIFSCPVGLELESCEFKNVRQHESKDKLIYYEALNMAEKEKLIKGHQKCLSAREKKTLFHESQ